MFEETVKELTTVKTRIDDMARLWCRWNRKEINGDDFAKQVEQLFPKEVMRKWNDQVNPMKADNPLEALLV